MAPLMVGAVIVSAGAFALISIWQFSAVESRLYQPSASTAAIAWTAPGREPTSFQQQMQLASAQARYSLELDSIARRYDAANSTFAMRLWTRLMGFLTGMILALVGATFVLGKLETDQSEVSAQGQGLSFNVRSASPGVIMGALGTVLMAIALIVPVTITTHDGAIYFLATDSGATGGGATNSGPATAPPLYLGPPPLSAIDSANPANATEPQPRTAPKFGGILQPPIVNREAEPPPRVMEKTP